MSIPKITIFAQGGTHGDFLYSCCLLMTEKKENSINNKGRIDLKNSDFKNNNLKSYVKGEKKSFDVNNRSNIEMCHIWQEEFKKLPGKFYYINYNEEQIDIIKKMYLEKVFYNNLDHAIKNIKKYLPKDLEKKIKKDNINQILTIFYKNSIKKYRKQPGIVSIEISHLYDFNKLVKILKNMDLFDADNVENLKKFHAEWTEKNIKYLEEMLKLSN